VTKRLAAALGAGDFSAPVDHSRTSHRGLKPSAEWLNRPWTQPRKGAEIPDLRTREGVVFIQKLGVAALFALAMTAALKTEGAAQSRGTAKDAAETAFIACAVAAGKDYTRAILPLLQTQPMSVEATIAQRRLQEQYCLRFAQCLIIGSQVAQAELYSSCLRTQADAAPRN
jgi:hypothetical protein